MLTSRAQRGHCRKLITLRFVSNRSQVESKPGRQMVTFLMVTNIAMWLLNTLETSRTRGNSFAQNYEEIDLT